MEAERAQLEAQMAELEAAQLGDAVQAKLKAKMEARMQIRPGRPGAFKRPLRSPQ